MYWAYILQNPAGKFYVGHSENVDVRMENHNRDGATEGKFTRKNGPWTVVWREEHPTRSAAVLREKQIKSMKSARWIREHLLGC